MSDDPKPVRARATIEEVHDAVGRLHAAAWHGRKGLGESAPRFSIPRQPTDDDEVVYAAIEELRSLRAEAARMRQALSRVADNDEAGDTQAQDWPEFWASVQKRARAVLAASNGGG